uniref:Uncharacterized protein n=1 Tax=Faecalibaculum rodentium TaxID=1702221 RepID=A0A140DV17_9FIRM|nr:hypothetical protein AALO17_13600 [Faecalibaculum rodentium]
MDSLFSDCQCRRTPEAGNATVMTDSAISRRKMTCLLK